MFRVIAVTVVCTALLTQIVRADNRDEDLLTDLQKVSPKIQVIATGGRWLHDSTVGTFRLVVREIGFEFQRDQVFIQWIRLADDASETDSVERTVPITEVHGLVTSHRFAHVGKLWKLVVRSEWLDHASQPPTKQHGYFVITPSADFTYTCHQFTREPDI